MKKTLENFEPDPDLLSSPDEITKATRDKVIDNFQCHLYIVNLPPCFRSSS